jgi:hypothetical protein
LNAHGQGHENVEFSHHGKYGKNGLSENRENMGGEDGGWMGTRFKGQGSRFKVQGSTAQLISGPIQKGKKGNKDLTKFNLTIRLFIRNILRQGENRQ